MSVDAYLDKLPAERRAAIAAVRDVVNANLPDGYAETLQYGMISWVIPLAIKPDTYNKQPLAIASLASQKSHMALYLLGVYGNPALEAWFRQAFAAAGKKLDMGKSCVRFKSLDALPLDVIGEVITKVPVATLIDEHDRAHSKEARAARSAARAAAAPAAPAASKTAASSATTTAATKTAATKTAATKTAATKTAAMKSASTKTASTKTASTKTASTKTAYTKTASTKTATKKVAMKKTATKKTATKKVAMKKTATKKTATKKVAMKKTATKNAATKKAVSKKTAP